MASKSSYASALHSTPLFASATPPPVVPPHPHPQPTSRWGSVKIDYDEIITKAFTIPPQNPTISWLLLRSIYHEHPERIEVTSSPHQNHKDDSLHISLKVFISNMGHYLTLHLYGTFTGSPDKGYIRWWNSTMEVQMGVKLVEGFCQIKEVVADWRQHTPPSTPTSAD